jgi:hypothetical protein
MYNMDISIGSYKFRLEILVLIVIFYWVMCGHMLCSCCRVGLFEGMAMVKEGLGGIRPSLPKPSLPKIPKPNLPRTREGFVGSNNMAAGPEFAEAKDSGYIMNPSTWSMPTLTYSPGATPDAGVKAIWDRPKQPIPLPEGQLSLFATTDFKPECCPNTFSSSTGCACMDLKTYTYLRERGGNNVPYSEF